MDYIETTLSLVHPSPTNPRKSFPADEMAEMIDSVKRHGILQPILVRPWPAHYVIGEGQFPAYELVAGERRYRAAKAANLDSIPVMIRNLCDNEVLEIQIIENLQRKGLHEIEEAEGYELMIREHGYTADQLAEKIGKSRAYIYGRMKLTALCTGARLAFRDGKLNASTALLIARIPGEKMQMEAIDKITGTWEGVMSFRRAAEVIQRDFCFFLEKAPFPQENLMLVTAAGACSACPKRSGTSPELHPETTRADVCTDPACYKAKSQAWVAYQAGEAKEAGRKVIVGKEAEKIDIEFNGGDYAKLDSRNYSVTLPGKDEHPTNREILEYLGDKAPASVLIENPRKGALVEAVSNNQLAKVLKEAGLKKSSEPSESEKAAKAKAEKETAFRGRLFEQLRAATRLTFIEYDTGLQPEESLLIARQFWSCLWRDNQIRVAHYWIEDGGKDQALIDAMTDKLNELGQHDLHVFLLDCALIGQTPVYSHNPDKAAPDLFERAKAFNLDIEAIRQGDTAKTAVPTATKSASTPPEAPLGAGVDSAKDEEERSLAIGDRVIINADAKGPSGHLRKCCGKEGDIEAIRGNVYAVRFSPGKSGVVANLARDEFKPAPQPITFSPSTAARAAVAYIHPENADLCWSGRGKKPKWVEHWLGQETGRTLDQLRVQEKGKKQSSASGEANAKPSMAEVVTRCTKTLELNLA